MYLFWMYPAPCSGTDTSTIVIDSVYIYMLSVFYCIRVYIYAKCLCMFLFFMDLAPYMFSVFQY